MVRFHDRLGPPGDPPDGEEAAEPDDPEAIDLHGLRPEDALRRLAQGIHACRVRRVDRLRIITGRGWGNLRQQPILRPRVEQWLAGPDGRRLGVLRIEVAEDGGSLLVDLRSDGHRRTDRDGTED
jgi:DNA-nicking Smr family endonuclease